METFVSGTMNEIPFTGTEFALVASSENVYDFTSYKLRTLARKAKDTKSRIMMSALFEDYNKGRIAVSWFNGSPRWLRVG